MNDITNLKKELDEKIHNLFKDNQAYLDYILQTKKNFLHRYLETSTDQDIIIKQSDGHTLIAQSYESNMGEAFKTSDQEIKEGIRLLAKTIPREQKPRVQYSLKTILDNVKSDNGKIVIESSVNWNFPEFTEKQGSYKKISILFEYQDPNIFRKQLALKFEEACALFN